MLFILRRPQELGRVRIIIMYMCFIDRQMTQDLVHREVLWVVLAGLDVP